MDSPHKERVTRKPFPYDDVIMVRAMFCWLGLNNDEIYQKGPFFIRFHGENGKISPKPFQ